MWGNILKMIVYGLVGAGIICFLYTVIAIGYMIIEKYKDKKEGERKIKTRIKRELIENQRFRLKQGFELLTREKVRMHAKDWVKYYQAVGWGWYIDNKIPSIAEIENTIMRLADDVKQKIILADYNERIKLISGGLFVEADMDSGIITIGFQDVFYIMPDSKTGRYYTTEGTYYKD